MALHTKLPIYRTGLDLLSFAYQVQEQMPRGMKRTVGEKITQHCTDILELMALANAAQDTRAHSWNLKGKCKKAYLDKVPAVCFQGCGTCD